MKENALAERLRHFQRKELLSASQLAELTQMPTSENAERSEGAATQRAEALMEKIRALGHLPRRSKEYGEEGALANQLRQAKKVKHLSASQLAELE